MTFNQHSLILHFGEADEECWELLKKLPQDRQESVIKEALKLYLGVQLESLRPKTIKLEHEFEHNYGINHELNHVQHQGDDHDHEHDLSYSQLPGPWSEKEPTSVSVNKTDEIGLPSDWQLDSLFISSENKREITDPLKHLFQIIGEEDDEEIIDFLSTSAKIPFTFTREGESPEGNVRSEIETEESLTSEARFQSGTMPISLESLQEENLIRSSGLSFILQQVIGKEEDEEVLEYFENSRRKDPEG